jgi:hypothetical protein
MFPYLASSSLRPSILDTNDFHSIEDCIMDYLFWKHKLLLILSPHQTLWYVMVQLGISLLETQAFSLIVYSPNPGVCFATLTISSGSTNFFSYCLHIKTGGLLCFPLPPPPYIPLSILQSPPHDMGRGGGAQASNVKKKL